MREVGALLDAERRCGGRSAYNHLRRPTRPSATSHGNPRTHRKCCDDRWKAPR